MIKISIIHMLENRFQIKKNSAHFVGRYFLVVINDDLLGALEVYWTQNLDANNVRLGCLKV